MSTGLSPNEIRNYEFPNQMRGYDKDEVREFLAQVATAHDNLKQENLKLSMEIESLKTQLESLKKFEEAIKDAAIDARRNADQTISDARQKAEEMLSQAKAQADQIVGSRADEARHLDEQITKLEEARSSYLEELRQLIDSHRTMINDIAELKAPERPQPTPAPAPVPDPERPVAKEPTPADTDDVQLPKAAAPTESVSPTPETTAPPTSVPTPRAGATAPVSLEQPAPVRPVDQLNGLEVTESTEVTRGRRETIADKPEEAEPERTEEANAPSRIVAVEQPDQPPAQQPVEPPPPAPQAAEPPPQPQTAQPAAPTEPALDPELAAALESYQQTHQETPELNRQPDPPATDRDESIRTNDPIDDSDTDKIPADASEQDGADSSTEHNAIDIDRNVGEEKKGENSMDPDALARELDEVAARFEEELDRAAKSQ